MSKLNDLLFALPAFIIGISILVAVHEFGHFWVARRLGIKTLRFSIGFGNVLWSRFGKDGTEYAISAIPLGGYVRMLDERDGNVAAVDLPRAFNRQPVWKRIAVLFAGPGFNFLFAIVAYSILLNIGEQTLRPFVGAVAPHSIAASAGLKQDDLIESIAGTPVVSAQAAMMEILDQVVDDGVVDMRVRSSDGLTREVNLLTENRSRELTEPGALFTGLGFEFQIPAIVGVVAPGGAGASAGLRSGDLVQRLDGLEVTSFTAMRALISDRANRAIDIEVLRGGQLITLHATVGRDTEGGREVGRLGIGPSDDSFVLTRVSGLAAVSGAVAKTWETSLFTVKFMWKLITGKVSAKSISGPLGIAKVAGTSAQYGGVAYLGFLALVSISIGILNLMPVPILDGGQIVYQLAELLKGGPVSERAQLLGQQVGIVLLGLLMILALFNDIAPHVS
jgi:regulator of sigma E protease